MKSAKRPKTRRELLDRLEAQRQEMRRHATTLLPEGKKERVRRGETDPFFFFQTYLPHYFTQSSPPFHKQLLKEASRPGINGLAAPRGFSKSTLITFAETLRLAVFGIIPFQIIVKENKDAATDEVASIQLELEENPRIAGDFGKMKKRGDWEEGDFTTTNGCRVLALGIGQSIRGKKHRQHRPGRIVIDDPEKDKHVKNPRLVKEQVDWVMEAVYPSLDPEGGIVTWLGTMMSKRGGLARLQGKEKVRSKIWAAIDKKGRSLWPARFPLSKLKEIRALVGSKAWRQEYMNAPGDDPDATFQEWMIKKYKESEVADAVILGTYSACDPSLRESTKHDFKAIINIRVAAQFRGMKGPFYLITKAWVRHTTLDRMFDELFLVNEQLHPSRMALETQSWQELLMRDIRRLEADKNIRLPILPMTNKVAKKARIERMQPLMERGLLLFLDDPDDEDFGELIDQFLGHDEDSIPDDGPDATEMCLRIAEQSGRKISKVRTW